MRKQRGVLFLALAFLACFAVLAPAPAHAVTNPCSTAAGQAINKRAAENEKKFVGDKYEYMKNLAGEFPAVQIVNSCVENIMKIFSALPGISSPMSMLSSMITGMVSSVLNQACQSVTSTVSSAQGSLKNLASVCVPMPSFDPISTPTFSASACSGGTRLNVLTSPTANTLFDSNAAYKNYLETTSQTTSP